MGPRANLREAAAGVNRAGEGAGRSVAVLGGGIVGLSCAIHLLRRGFAVTLVERGAPGGGTSFGNAGAISRGSILPVAMPEMRRRAWRYLANRDPAVRVRHAALPGLAGWLLRFLRQADAATARRTAGHLNALVAHALDAHLELMDEAGATGLLRRTGFLKVYRTENSLAAAAFERALLAAHGIGFEMLAAGELHDLEPHLAARFSGAMLVTGSASVSDPGALCASYHRLFERLGGRTHRAEAGRIRPREGRWTVDTTGGEITADMVVVALGPWSPDLLRPLGLRLPLAVELGYHTHRQPAGNAFLSRPVYDVDGAYVLAPMRQGIRVTSGSELARRDARPTPVQLARVLVTAHAAFPMVEEALRPDTVWRGARPSFPDSLPVVGPAPGHPGLWLAFGHGHIGLSTGPITGRLIAAAMAGATPTVDLAPYAASRWS